MADIKNRIFKEVKVMHSVSTIFSSGPCQSFSGCHFFFLTSMLDPVAIVIWCCCSRSKERRKKKDADSPPGDRVESDA